MQSYTAGRYCVGVPNPVANPYSLFRVHSAALRTAPLRNTPGIQNKVSGHRASQFAATRSQTRAAALIIFLENESPGFCGADKQIKVSGEFHRGSPSTRQCYRRITRRNWEEIPAAHLKAVPLVAVLCGEPLCPRRRRGEEFIFAQSQDMYPLWRRLPDLRVRPAHWDSEFDKSRAYVDIW